MRPGANTSVYALFGDERVVDSVCQTLSAHGFRAEDIAYLSAHNSGSMDMGLERRTHVPHGVATGGALGMVVGGVAMALTLKFAPSVLHLPAQLPWAWPVLASMAPGALIGSLLGGLWGIGVPQFVAKRYAGRKRQPGLLVSVHCDDATWALKARTLLEEAHALDITFGKEARADFQSSARPSSIHPADRYLSQ